MYKIPVVTRLQQQTSHQFFFGFVLVSGLCFPFLGFEVGGYRIDSHTKEISERKKVKIKDIVPTTPWKNKKFLNPKNQEWRWMVQLMFLFTCWGDF